MKARRLLVCSGSSCRKASKKKGWLGESMAAFPLPVERVGCQKICKGPVVGFPVEGELQWFRRMDSRKAWRALRGLAEEGGILAGPLRKRRVRKRAGKLRA